MKIAVEEAPVPGSLTCPATLSWCREYNYDHFGNRWVTSNRTMHMAVPSSQSAFNAANNRLTAASYDAAGNMTSHPWITPSGSMAYNANNLMTSFTATGVSVQTTYDAEGRRVRKINGTEVTLWVYDASGRLAAEYRNGTGPGFAPSTPDREYSYGLVSVVHEGSNRYYRTTDHLGSTRIVTDQTGAVKQRRDFFPFGEEIPADSSHGGRNAVLDGGVATYNASLGVRQQFTGQQRDSETGLDYFWARNLSAPLGRFLSMDPSGEGTCPHCPQTWNAYLYVKNSPLRYRDPTGARYCDPWEQRRWRHWLDTSDDDACEPGDLDLDVIYRSGGGGGSVGGGGDLNALRLESEGEVGQHPYWNMTNWRVLAATMWRLATWNQEENEKEHGRNGFPYTIKLVDECRDGIIRNRLYQVVDQDGNPFIGIVGVVREQNVILNDGYLTSGNGTFHLGWNAGVDGTAYSASFVDTVGGTSHIEQYQYFAGVFDGIWVGPLTIDQPQTGGVTSGNRISQGRNGVTINDVSMDGLPDCPKGRTEF